MLEDILRDISDPRNFLAYCESFLRVQTKDGKLVPFVLNAVQRALYEAVLPFRIAGGGAAFIILKSRQVGVSTIIEALGYEDTSLTPDHRGLIIAHDESTGQHLNGMYQRYHNNFPKEIRTLATKQNDSEIDFGGIRSQVHVRTAGSKYAGTGVTYQFVHISELAKWPFPEETMLSLGPSIPKTALKFVESTPNGIGNYFHRLWTAAVEGQNEYIPLFFPWFQDVGYRRDKVRSGTDLYDYQPTGDERYYAERYDLDQKQVNWMRATTMNECGGDFDLFLQEYPFDDFSCFLGSGKPYFDMGALKDLDLELRKDPPESIRCDIIDGEVQVSAKGEIVLFDVPDPEEKIAYRYVIGADCCEGGNKMPLQDDGQKRAGDSDFNFVYVWDKVLHNQVAESRQRLDPDLFARLLFELWCFYGNGLERAFWPLMIVERNNPGQAVLMELKRLASAHGIPFSRMFHEGDMDREGEPTIKDLGFRTQGAGEAPRLTILQAVQKMVRRRESGIRSNVVVNQCMTFVKDDKQRPAAQQGRFDDGVIAVALAIEGERRDHIYYRIKKPVEVPKWVQKLRGESDGNNPYKVKSIDNPYR